MAFMKLTASDGQSLQAYRVEPLGTPRGGLVVIQEIFGINSHIRQVCDGFAAEGYSVVAPALYHRVEPGVELGYEADDFGRGRDLRAKVGWDAPLLDITAAVAALGDVGNVGAVGYCWGGSLAWLCSTRSLVKAAVGYYGGQINEFIDEQPQCPVLLHFGETDAHIPVEKVGEIKRAHPEVPVYLYPAGHGFNCDQRADYSGENAALARERTLSFLAQHL